MHPNPTQAGKYMKCPGDPPGVALPFSTRTIRYWLSNTRKIFRPIIAARIRSLHLEPRHQ